MADYETLHVCRVPYCQQCVKFWWWLSDPINFYFLLLLFFVTSSSTLCYRVAPRIFNTFHSLPYPCSELSHTLYYFHIFIYYFHILNCMVIFFLYCHYMLMGRIKIILILMVILLNLVKGKLLIICGCAHYIFMLFLLVIADSQNECMLIIILLSTNRVKKGLGPNCPFYGLNLPTVAGIIL